MNGLLCAFAWFDEACNQTVKGAGAAPVLGQENFELSRGVCPGNGRNDRWANSRILHHPAFAAYRGQFFVCQGSPRATGSAELGASAPMADMDGPSGQAKSRICLCPQKRPQRQLLQPKLGKQLRKHRHSGARPVADPAKVDGQHRPASNQADRHHLGCGKPTGKGPVELLKSGQGAEVRTSSWEENGSVSDRQNTAIVVKIHLWIVPREAELAYTGKTMTLQQFFRIVEIRTKIVSASTLTLGLLYVLFVRGYVDPLLATLVIAAALFVDMATTAFNSFFDFERRIDSKSTNRETDKVLVHEGVPSGYALATSIVFYTLAAVLGIILTILQGWLILVLGAASLAVGYLYSGGPYPISRTPVGELFAGGFLGTVLFLVVGLTQGLAVDWAMVLASLPGTIHIAAILTVNNTCDIEGDKAAGRRTLSILIGNRASQVLLVLEILAAYLVIFLVLSPSVPTIALVFIGLSGSGLCLRTMIRRGFSHATKGPSMGGISQSFLLFSLCYAAAFLIEILARN